MIVYLNIKKKGNNLKLQLEINNKFVKSNDTFVNSSGGVVMFTPNIGKDYWLFRVKVSKNQAILGFPKFYQIGVGFAKEKNSNTNLPTYCDSEKIFNHIKDNKGSKNISDAECIKAIQMIRDAAKRYKHLYKSLS